ncbi:MAG TPA: hypothetical protein VNX86_00910 [Rhizomicrobium sp.]|jgi:hypothetical protein|nr:hypothetical protein [Rhizomicrobium sp.]
MTKTELEEQNEDLIGFLISLRDAIDDKLDELGADDAEDDDTECPAADD